MKVINRSDSNVTYSLPEFQVPRRLFEPWQPKDISEEELEALFASDSGADLIKKYLLVQDKDWVKKHFDAPIEYFWGKKEIENCVLNESLELFEDTLDYAPDGVIDIIKTMAWQRPLTDLNKIKVLHEKTGFDVLASIEIMKESTARKPVEVPARRRKEA